MISALLEGVRSVALPCSLTLVVPGVAVVLAARKQPLAAGSGFIVGLVLVGWLRSIGYLDGTPTPAIAVVLGPAVLLGVVGLAVSPSVREATYLLGALPGMAAGWIWQPCVGAELGGILSRGPTEPAAVFPLMAAYLVGVALVVVAVALIRVVGAETKEPRRWLTSTGVALGTIVAVTLGVGIYRDIVGWLALVSV